MNRVLAILLLAGFALTLAPLSAAEDLPAAREIVDRFPNAVHVPLDFDPDPEEFAGDGYHPSEESYSKFGRRMADRLLGLA